MRARIPPLENRGDQLNAVPEVGARRRQQVVLPVLEGRQLVRNAWLRYLSMHGRAEDKQHGFVFYGGRMTPPFLINLALN